MCLILPYSSNRELDYVTLACPPVNYFTDRSKAVLHLWIFYDFSVLCLLCLCARLFIGALWSPAGKELTSWLLFMVSSCEFVTFPLVSLVRCVSKLYRFLIFAPLLSLLISLCVRRKIVLRCQSYTDSYVSYSSCTLLTSICLPKILKWHNRIVNKH